MEIEKRMGIDLKMGEGLSLQQNTVRVEKYLQQVQECVSIVFVVSIIWQPTHKTTISSVLFYVKSNRSRIQFIKTMKLFITQKKIHYALKRQAAEPNQFVKI